MNKKTILKTLVIGLLSILVISSITPSASNQIKQDNIKTFSMTDWSDNFDSYSNGQILDDFSTGDGGWGGWNNNLAAYGTVTNAKSRSSPNSVEISADTDLVHQYSGYTTGVWVYTAWQYIPTDFSGQTYFIMLCGYDGGGTGTVWTVQVHFDTDVESEFGTQQLPIILGRWVEIRCVIDLDSDWLEIYYDNELLAEHAYTGTVQGLGGGTKNIAAVDLFGHYATPVYYDDISLEPYTAALTCDAGGPYACQLSNSIDFSGIAHGGTAPYTYLWDFGNGDTSTLQNPTYTYSLPGIYTVNLTVTDNVAGTDLDTTSADVSGEEPEPKISCEGSLVWEKVKAGSTVNGTFQVCNSGETESLLNWEVSEFPTWGNWTFTPASGTGLAEGDCVTINVEVVAPAQKKKTFTGTIKMDNLDNETDVCEIEVSLTTPRARTNNIIQLILERFPNAFPILRYILG